ncbi:ABC transporter permease [Desulfococcus multivorans]|uniref:ABC-type transporter, integral membrane subunit n=1 Tax=Desulfococcus multivorans DSM 2059 TaxID=1121405 RepID=S7U1N4_DESML|nr:ABC transporter permease [Desulfococcus multivorans]AOY58554.1 putative ABC transporter, permease protein [Desulfococcus multivorans]AQV00861.1 ABC transporter permease [Desulfococcus multivorans]EPR43336.1 ABC-type transporter, integral membrane subunit [Desulfococcus multivorans DSM 2059]SJZ43182.1 NitT/TauT family transport system permease protein [Desulfococcus multivorans DSM 2059]
MEKSNAGGRRLIPWIIPAACITGWFFISETDRIPAYLLPHPKDIARSAYAYILGTAGSTPYAGRFLTDTAASLGRVALGFLIAALAGVPLGILSGRVAVFRQLLSGSVNAVRAVPGISWLPLALVWFGIGMKTTIFLVALAAFFPIYLNAATGARQVDILLLQAGAMMGTGRIRGVFAILIPAAMPHIVTGLRLGLGVSWAYLVLGELTGVPYGLGAVIMDARMLGRIDIVIVGIIVIAVMGQASDRMLDCLLKLSFKSARRSG